DFQKMLILSRFIGVDESVIHDFVLQSSVIPKLTQGMGDTAFSCLFLLTVDLFADTNFVLAGYKTEQCTKPPRLCRQGYACPHYHNSRDRRRNPRAFKYRSTPCPSVKHADEWGEPSRCESGDSCQYCHSRTEQQFHPEIYKSTKCNDMRQTGYCPRGPFCAFAHGESKRLLESSAPVNIPGSLVRSSSLHSSSSLSTSPLNSLSQSLSQSFVSSTMVPHQQQPQPLKSEQNILGTSASSHNSLGLNGVTGSMWDFVAGNFSPSPSPVLSSGTAPPVSPNSSGNELTRVRQELDDAKRKLKQWEESWQQVKQACDAWQKEAQEANERADVASADKQLALQKKEAVENKLKKLKVQLAACLSTALPYMENYGDIEKISLPKLRSLQSRLHLDLGTIDEVIFQLQSKKCVVCQEGDRSIVLTPCQHYILCDHCAAKQEECPCCKKKSNLW
uniref:Unk like zinc finger n=1 Tax=Pavo cristatus TaxID=9049 RepID=A0A8C9F0H9_PAVCR